MIAMLGDDCEDHMAKSGVRWLQKSFAIAVLTLSPAHKDYSHCNIPTSFAFSTFPADTTLSSIISAGMDMTP